MDHDALINKLQKLLTLAQRGEGGEAVNARALLDRMLAQYGIDETSLTDIRTLRYVTDYDDERGLLEVVASYALQIPTVQVRGEIITGEDALGMDLTATVEQHGLIASLYEYHRTGLEQSIKRLGGDQERQRANIADQITQLTAKIRTLKAILANFTKSAQVARDTLLCAYVNLNNLVDYAGWRESSGGNADNITNAAASCVRLDPDIKQLPGQRLGDTNNSHDL